MDGQGGYQLIGINIQHIGIGINGIGYDLKIGIGMIFSID